MTSKASVHPDERRLKVGGVYDSESTLQRLRNAEEELLRQCSLDNALKDRLFAVLDKIRTRAESTDDMIKMFGSKCFKSEPTEKDRIKASHDFCKTAFGDIDRLYRKGPKSTFHKMVVNLALYKGLSQKSEFRFKFGDYRVGRKLGEGATAMVYYGENSKTGLQVAIKVFKPLHTTLKMAREEYRKIQTLRHPNIIRAVDFFEGATWHMPGAKPGDKERKVYTSVMIMEYCAKGELMGLLKDGGKFDSKLARWAFKGIISALDYIHSRDLAHCDLKLANCFVSGDETNKASKVVVGDFGFVTEMGPDDKQTKNYGTPQYYAPEMHLNVSWKRDVDLFSLGIMLFVMLFGYFPFERAIESDPWYKRVIHNRWDKFWKSHAKQHTVTDLEKELLQGLLSYQPSERMKINQIRRHPWVERASMPDNEAYAELQHRKFKADSQTMSQNDAQQTRKDRAIAPWNDKLDRPAPLYHTDVPIGDKAWFYSHDSARVILLTISDIIKDTMGTTDCNVAYKEWEAYLDRREKAGKIRELPKTAPKIPRSESEEEFQKLTGLAPSAIKMTEASKAKAEAAAASEEKIEEPAAAAAPALASRPAGAPEEEESELADLERTITMLRANLEFAVEAGLSEEELQAMRDDIAAAESDAAALRESGAGDSEENKREPATPRTAMPVRTAYFDGGLEIPLDDLNTCEGRIVYEQFELNFEVVVTKERIVEKKAKKKDKDKDAKVKTKKYQRKLRQKGIVQVFACPAHPKYSIVFFVPASDAIVLESNDPIYNVGDVDRSNGDPRQGFVQTGGLFREIYKSIIDKGGNALMADTRDTRKELIKMQGKVPQLDGLDDLLDED